MHIPFVIASKSPDVIYGILILVVAAIIVAGPLVYRILSGEKFGWFGDPHLRRPNKKEWEELRRKADKIFKGDIEIDANELYELVTTMNIEVAGYKRNKGTTEYENDLERIAKLSQKLQGMELRIDPFDSLLKHLKEDGLIEQANKLHDMIHSASPKSFSQAKNECLAELIKIKNEKLSILNPETQKKLKQSIKLLKSKPFTSVYIYITLLVIGLALRFYHSIVQNKGYKFYKENPVWIVVFILIIGVPAVVLAIKFLMRKFGTKENPYQLNLIEKQ
jgi:hypothetical protein